MNDQDYCILRTLANQFYDIVDMMLVEIKDGTISSNDMDKYTDQIVAICETITTIYRERGGFTDV